MLFCGRFELLEADGAALALYAELVIEVNYVALDVLPEFVAPRDLTLMVDAPVLLRLFDEVEVGVASNDLVGADYFVRQLLIVAGVDEHGALEPSILTGALILDVALVKVLFEHLDDLADL